VTLPQILALTFTEKAAEEMKGRVYDMLLRLDHQIRSRPSFDESLRNKIREAQERFQTNHISTIHSFCAHLLRNHPVESGIDPGFAVIQGARQRKIMAEAVDTGLFTMLQTRKEDLALLLQTFGTRNRVFRAIQAIISHPLTFRRVLATTKRLFSNEEWPRQVFNDYCRFIKDDYLIPYAKALRKLPKKGAAYEELLALMEAWEQAEAQSPPDAGVTELFCRLREMNANRKPRSPKLTVREGLREISYVDLVDSFFPDVFDRSSPDRSFKEQLILFLDAAAICLNRYQAAKRKVNALDFADLEAYAHAMLERLFQEEKGHALKSIQQKFKYLMIDEFQDTNRVQWEIIRYLSSDKGRDESPNLRKGKLFVVGDKRQAIYGFRGGDVTVFESATGQIKQSNGAHPAPLYWEDPAFNACLGALIGDYGAWLKGHREAFEALAPAHQSQIGRGDVYLPHSFRTARRPLATINDTFEAVFSNKGASRLEEYETAPKPIAMPPTDRRQRPEEGSVTFYLTRASGARRERMTNEASLIVDIIERLLGKQGKDAFEYRTYGDIRTKIEKDELAIGVLFFAFTHVKTFETFLREARLPFKVHRGKGFFQCPEVMEMIQLLNYLSDERRHISLLAALRSPIFAFSDPEIFDLFYGAEPTLERFQASGNRRARAFVRQIQSWRLLSSRLTLAELIRRIIADRHMTAIYSVHPNGRQRLANVEKLIEIARRFQEDGSGSLREFVAYCLEMAEEEEEEGEALIVSGGESPIHLMTIHSAKGLEFPMVMIPDLNRKLPSRIEPGKPMRVYGSSEAKPGVWNSAEGEIPVWPVEMAELRYRKAYGPLGHLLMHRNRLEAMAENRRVFYVGCTRTESHLILIGNMEKRHLDEKRTALSSKDYRERATTMDLLDDIYRFNTRFPPTDSEIHEGDETLPNVIWRDPRPRAFRGVSREEARLSREEFGRYDSKARSLDLTGPITTPPYYQFSFKSIRLFRQCRLRFYYGVILGFKWDIMGQATVLEEDRGRHREGPDAGQDWEYGSREALLVGNVIHAYLEHHRFGQPLDERLFGSVFERIHQLDQTAASMDKKKLERLKRKACRQIETTVMDERLLEIGDGTSQNAEVPFLVTISEGCEFRGTVDRMIRNRERGDWTIIDWKSNDLEDKDPHKLAREWDYDLQLACYQYALERILDEKVGALYLYFTDGGHLVPIQSDEEVETIIGEMLEEVADYEHNRDRWVADLREVKKDPRECRHCEYGRLCEQRRRGV
jgi:ATP-dependent helicase/nuclease subunit A